jgi:hypothetical protein
MIRSWQDYNIGFHESGWILELNMTGEDRNGRERTGEDKILRSRCLTGFAKKKFRAGEEIPNSKPQAPKERREIPSGRRGAPTLPAAAHAQRSPREPHHVAGRRARTKKGEVPLPYVSGYKLQAAELPLRLCGIND